MQLRPGIPCGQGRATQEMARPRAQHSDVVSIGQPALRQHREANGVYPPARRRVVLRLTATRGAAVSAQAGAPVKYPQVVIHEHQRRPVVAQKGRSGGHSGEDHGTAFVDLERMFVDLAYQL